jgi:hypothetical protein
MRTISKCAQTTKLEFSPLRPRSLRGSHLLTKTAPQMRSRWCCYAACSPQRSGLSSARVTFPSVMRSISAQRSCGTMPRLRHSDTEGDLIFSAAANRQTLPWRREESPDGHGLAQGTLPARQRDHARDREGLELHVRLAALRRKATCWRFRLRSRVCLRLYSRAYKAQQRDFSLTWPR